MSAKKIQLLNFKGTDGSVEIVGVYGKRLQIKGITSAEANIQMAFISTEGINNHLEREMLASEINKRNVNIKSRNPLKMLAVIERRQETPR